MLGRAREEVARLQAALAANSDRLSRRYLAEREANLRLSDRQKAAFEARREAAEAADRARRRLWHALEAMRDGFAVFDTNGRIVAANSVYLQLFDAADSIGPGASADELFSGAATEGCFDIGDAEPEVWVRRHIARWSSVEIATVELHLFDGRLIRLQDRRAPDGDIVSLAVDLTAERERSEALRATRDEARAMARMRSDFVTRISHEMRTPMNGVVGLADMMLQRDGLDTDVVLWARTIRDSAESLLGIVDNTFDLASLQDGTIEIRPEQFDLESMLADCLRLTGAALCAGVVTIFDYPLNGPMHVVGDGPRLRQVVMNLLSNAARATKVGYVMVSTRVEPRSGGRVEVEIMVEDSGPGIPDFERDRIFDAFARTEGSKAPEGVGLGLTIARGLIERMGGVLTVEPAAGGGARFSASLVMDLGERGVEHRWPSVIAISGSGIRAEVLKKRVQEAGMRLAAPGHGVPVLCMAGSDASHARGLSGEDLPPASDHPDFDEQFDIGTEPMLSSELAVILSRHRSRDRILLADDNATNRMLLEAMLRGTPWEVEIVSDGAEVVAAHAERPAQAIVLDISMPVLDGFGAAELLKASTPTPPLIALTAHQGEDMEERLKVAGFDRYLTKPVRRESLLAVISGVLGVSSLL